MGGGGIFEPVLPYLLAKITIFLFELELYEFDMIKAVRNRDIVVFIKVVLLGWEHSSEVPYIVTLSFNVLFLSKEAIVYWLLSQIHNNTGGGGGGGVNKEYVQETLSEKQ